MSSKNNYLYACIPVNTDNENKNILVIMLENGKEVELNTCINDGIVKSNIKTLDGYVKLPMSVLIDLLKYSYDKISCNEINNFIDLLYEKEESLKFIMYQLIITKNSSSNKVSYEEKEICNTIFMLFVSAFKKATKSKRWINKTNKSLA
jgi:hypothetical protein